VRVALHPCYILHQRSYRETSLILDIFSRDYGKLSLVARGAKRKKSADRYLMQPNQRLKLAWSIRGEMGTLTAIEADGLAYNLQDKGLLAAFYLNELTTRLLHAHEAHIELFNAYARALNDLNDRLAEQPILRIFEKQLLQSLGYGLVLTHDVETGLQIESDRDYFYHFGHGPRINSDTGSDYIKIKGSSLIALEQEDLIDPSCLEQIKPLMRHTLSKYLGARPLASRELYQAYLHNKAKE